MSNNYNNKEVSIIIPAYKADSFIEECLDSIRSQNNLLNYKYEILVGIDACDKTKNKLLEIRDAYKFIKIFWFPTNVGGYIVRNTLAYNANYCNFIFFDADDIMSSILIDNVLEYLNEYPVVRFMYSNFGEGSWVGRKAPCTASGVFGIRANVFKSLGGFMKFRVSSDENFRNRLARSIYKTVNINENLFFRRRHKGSLTGDPLTRQRSDYRNNIHKEMQKLTNKKIEPVFGEYQLI